MEKLFSKHFTTNVIRQDEEVELFDLYAFVNVYCRQFMMLPIKMLQFSAAVF